MADAELQRRLQELEAQVARAREREQALRETNRSLIELINASPAAIITLDPRGKVKMWNPAAELIFGWKAEEVLDRTNPIVPQDRLDWFINRHTQVVEGDALIGLEVPREKKDGTPVDVSISTALVRNDYGTVERVIGIVLDITERKRFEREIQELNATLEERVHQRTAELEEAVADLESFSYSVSHDLRAPLRSIDGFANVLLEDYEQVLDEEGQRLLSVIVRNANRMSELIDDLLAFSRTGRTPLSRSRTSLGAMVAEVLEELKGVESDRRLQVEVGELPDAVVDSSMFRQVLVNLLSNALKFTRGRDLARIQVGGSQEVDELVYWVQDNGAGFDMRYADKLFGVFARLHRQDEFEGTGVGLAIVAKIVHRHGGTISASSQPGAGARFEIRLPIICDVPPGGTDPRIEKHDADRWASERHERQSRLDHTF